MFAVAVLSLSPELRCPPGVSHADVLLVCVSCLQLVLLIML